MDLGKSLSIEFIDMKFFYRNGNVYTNPYFSLYSILSMRSNLGLSLEHIDRSAKTVDYRVLKGTHE